MAMICTHCKTDAPDGVKYCPRCQNRMPTIADFPASPQSPVAGTFGDPGKPYYVTIVGHGMKNLVDLTRFPFKRIDENALSVDVWVDGQFAGTVPPDGRIDLHLDKNPVEVRMCAKALQDRGWWNTTLQKIEERCCFKIVVGAWTKWRGLHLKKIPVRW